MAKRRHAPTVILPAALLGIAAAVAFAVLVWERNVAHASHAAFVVNSTGDAGDFAPADGICETAPRNSICTLRAAIVQAHSHPGADLITFNISPGGAQTITPGLRLPEITDPVTIDGTTQPGFAGAPLIELNGVNVTG